MGGEGGAEALKKADAVAVDEEDGGGVQFVSVKVEGEVAELGAVALDEFVEELADGMDRGGEVDMGGLGGVSEATVKMNVNNHL